jgi:transcriptional regulator with XRE-family HTH domain
MLAPLLKEKSMGLDLSFRQVAKEVGVSHATIIRAMNGEVVDLDTLIKMSEWLNVKPHTLLNSMSSANNVLADQIAVILDRNPKLKDLFNRAIKEIIDGDVGPDIIDDITAYAVFKLGIYPKRKHTVSDIGK